MARWTAKNIGDQTGRVAVVTGANSGIGYNTALELARRGATVVVASRSQEKGEDAVRRIEAEGVSGTAVFLQLDLADLASIEAFANAFRDRYERLDLLINNAGVMMPPQSTTADGFELQFGTNHLGHFALVGRLLDRVLSTPDARVVTVASMAHRGGTMDFDDLHSRNKPYRRMALYSQSKLANLLFTRELQRRLEAAGAKAISVAAHPGWTATNLQRTVGLARMLNPFMAMQSWQGALPTLFAAVEPGVAGGEYIGPDGFMEARGYPKRASSTAAANDMEAAKRLWQISVEETGVRYEGLDTAAA